MLFATLMPGVTSGEVAPNFAMNFFESVERLSGSELGCLRSAAVLGAVGVGGAGTAMVLLAADGLGAVPRAVRGIAIPAAPLIKPGDIDGRGVRDGRGLTGMPLLAAMV